jgi:integrase
VNAIDLGDYDQSARLTSCELDALNGLVKAFDAKRFKWPSGTERALERLLCPLGDVLEFIGSHQRSQVQAVRIMIRAMNATQVAYWGWDRTQWTQLFKDHPTTASLKVARPVIRAFAYLLGNVRQLPETDECSRFYFAALVFGREAVYKSTTQVIDQLISWGYTHAELDSHVREVLSEFFLVIGSPNLKQLPVDIVARTHWASPPVHYEKTIRAISRALVVLGYIQKPLLISTTPTITDVRPCATEGIAAEWVGWCQRWQQTSTLAPSSVEDYYYRLLKVGRWLAFTHPHVTSPAHWTRELVVEFIAAVNHMKCGEFVSSQPHILHAGQPLSAAVKVQMIHAMSVFLRNCQEWEWISRTFSPERCLVGPRHLKAQLQPNPRIIDDALWAKLIWAGLHLTAEDVAGYTYPFEFVRAIALIWLFSGLRKNEIARLRVGCIRWLDSTAPSTQNQAPAAKVCLLDVPVNKTSGAFTKPIAQLAGQAVADWEALRPKQPPFVDPKTGELVHYLFAFRGKGVGENFINEHLIPVLCRKAGVPQEDQRGKLSSHRARATIATQLANAKDPMSLLELQQWLGHSTPLSTRYYVRVMPTRLTRAYADAGYLDRNIRAIEVLVDQDAIRSGAAATGEPWKYYDLGHGHCTYDFFDQCPHRMACARCDFYVPKESAKAQLLQAKTNLLRMKQEIPLLEDELAALDSDLAAIDHLCSKLADVPSPSGQTPRQLISGNFIRLDEVG